MTNKTYQFYGTSGTITLGFIDGSPFISGSNILPNPTDKKKYDYDPARSAFFVFNKLDEMSRMLEILEYLISQGRYFETTITETFVKKYDFQNNKLIQHINLSRFISEDGKNRWFGLDINDENKKVSVQWDSNKNLSHILLLREFFKVAIDKVIENSVTNPVVNINHSEDRPYSYMKEKEEVKPDSRASYINENDFDDYLGE